MVRLAGGVLNRGQDVFAFQKWIILEDFLEGSPGTEQFQHIGHAESFATNTGVTTTLAWLNGDALKQFRFHACSKVPHSFAANKLKNTFPHVRTGRILSENSNGVESYGNKMVMNGDSSEDARGLHCCS